MKDHQTDLWQLQSFLRSKLFKEHKNIDKLPVQTNDKTNKQTTKINSVLTLLCLQSHNITLHYELSNCVSRLKESRKCKWKYNIKMKFKELEGKGLEWKYLTKQGEKGVAVVNLVLNCRAP